MKQTMKRLTALLLTLSLVMGLVCIGAAATNTDTSPDGTQTTVYINPVYKNLVGVQDLEQPETGELESPDLYATTYYTTVAAAGKVMRAQLKKRTKTIRIHYKTKGSFNNLSHSIANNALEHTRVPTEGDYLAFQYAGWSCVTSSMTKNGLHYLTLTYTVTYYTSAAQENQMNTAVSNLRSQLGLSGMSTLDKIGTVYDFMCRNIYYDYTHLNDSGYKLKYTGYAALVNRSAVCQGYAVLFYRMMLQEKVDCRIISGLGNGGAHSWNIVRIGNKYYNLDATWDASRTQNGGDWMYFMLCNNNFFNHQRGSAYNTAAFSKQFPTSTVDLSMAILNKIERNHKSYHFWHKWSTVASNYTKAGAKTYVCSVCNKVNKVTVPRKVKITNLKNLKGRTLKVTWGKNTAATGYQLECSTAKNFKKGCKRHLTSKVTWEFDKLKKNGIYYVRVRTYKTQNGTRYFSGWSTSRKLKIKI